MAAPARSFSVLPDPDDELASPPPGLNLGAAAQGAAVAGLMLALRTLSQRTLVALADLFTLITCGSAFWLWMSIPDPNPHQLIGLGMYGMFVLAANLITRRKPA